MPVGMVGMPDAVGRGLASIHDVTVTVAPGLQKVMLILNSRMTGCAYVDGERSGWASAKASLSRLFVKIPPMTPPAAPTNMITAISTSRPHIGRPQSTLLLLFSLHLSLKLLSESLPAVHAAATFKGTWWSEEGEAVGCGNIGASDRSWVWPPVAVLSCGTGSFGTPLSG